MGASDSTPFGRGVGPSVVGQLVRDRSLRLGRTGDRAELRTMPTPSAA